MRARAIASFVVGVLAVAACGARTPAPRPALVAVGAVDAGPALAVRAEPDAGVADAAPPPHRWRAWTPATRVTFLFGPNDAALGRDGAYAAELLAHTIVAQPRLERLRVVARAIAGERKGVALERARAVVTALAAGGVATNRLEVKVDSEVERSAEVFVVRRGGVALEPPPWLSLHPEPTIDELRTFEQLAGRVRGATMFREGERASDEEGEKLLDADRAACAACNGVWGPQGMLGIASCRCRTKDGGKPCTRPSDCEARCAIPWETAIGMRDVACDERGCTPPGTTLSGTCEVFHEHFGCRGWIAEERVGKSVVRRVYSICVD